VSSGLNPTTLDLIVTLVFETSLKE
jgi:hypothetical protein